jgi:hypothetical protein
MVMKKQSLGIILCILVISTLSVNVTVSAEERTIIGTITEAHQLITDNGDVYDFSNNEQTKKLIKNINMKMEIKGTVETDEETGSKYIKVSSFKPVEKEDHTSNSN